MAPTPGGLDLAAAEETLPPELSAERPRAKFGKTSGLGSVTRPCFGLQRLLDHRQDRAAAPVLQVVGDPARARAFWAFGHGMVVLELAGRFPPDADLDTAWRAGVNAFQPRH